MEIERKHLVTSDAWRQHATQPPIHIVQHYFPETAAGGVSIQHIEQGDGRHMLMFKHLIDHKTMVVPISTAAWQRLGTGGQQALFSQGGFLNLDERSAGRVRFADDNAYLTLKTESGASGSRHEFECEIHPAIGQMLQKDFATSCVEKDRYLVPAGGGLSWEVDVYRGANAPLVTAEIELPDAQAHFVKPSWLGADVTDIGRYANAALAQKPYGQWSDADRVISSAMTR